MTEHGLPSSMIITAATDVAVLNGRRVRHGLRAIGAIKVFAQDRDDRAVGARADVDPALAGGLDAFSAIAAHKAEDAETGAEALLGVRFGLQDQLHQPSGCWADLSGLASQPARRPVSIAPVCA